MESDEDTQLFSRTEEESSFPSRQRKLKRLKKAVSISNNPLLHDLGDDGASNYTYAVTSSVLESHYLDTSKRRDLDDLDELRSRSESESLPEGNELSSGFEGLEFEEESAVAKRALNFDSVVEDLDELVQDRNGNDGEENVDKGLEESEKERIGLDLLEENKDNKKNKKKRSRQDGDGDELKKSPTKKMATKDRRANLNQLRAESQRLLRETRDAAFKPLPLIQKPISSILAKIRQRKQEVLKKSVVLKNLFVDDNNYVSKVSMEYDPKNFPIDGREYDSLEKAGDKGAISQHVDLESKLDMSKLDPANEDANKFSPARMSSELGLEKETNQTFRAPLDDTQDLFSDSQTSDINNEPSDEHPSSPFEEILAPSLLTMNLKLDSVPHHDDSFDEEDNDKENVSPQLHNLVSPKGNLAKAFLDDEAVEEDDSENDMFRFQENEEDEDNIDPEELRDMIAVGYKEKQIDTERRNELHQKWLEQQDATGTENLLQRLNYGLKQKETHLVEAVDEELEGAEDASEFSEEDKEDSVQSNARTNLKKCKQMIPHMFSNKDDVYLSSDDEEAEKRIVKQCLIEKTERKDTFKSPAEDETSREVFSLIKKLNVVSETKKKVRTSSHFDMLMTTRNSTSSFKSSFIRRGSNCSLPSLQKNGSGKVRSFIFERDDSNSRSGTSMSVESSDVIQREKMPTRNASAKINSTQKKSEPEMNSGISLFEILRRSSSVPLKKSNQDPIVGQAEAIYASFKLPTKQSKRA